MSDLEQWLEEHPDNSVECYDCPEVIRKGDTYYMVDGKMYCKECGSNE